MDLVTILAQTASTTANSGEAVVPMDMIWALITRAHWICSRITAVSMVCLLPIQT